MRIEPFTIAVPDGQLADLDRRLRQTRWPEQADDTGWDDGTDGAFLRRLAGYWRSGFDWRAQEARLNALPQFVTELCSPTRAAMAATRPTRSTSSCRRCRGSASRKSRAGRVSTPDKWPSFGHG